MVVVVGLHALIWVGDRNHLDSFGIPYVNRAETDIFSHGRFSAAEGTCPDHRKSIQLDDKSFRQAAS